MNSLYIFFRIIIGILNCNNVNGGPWVYYISLYYEVSPSLNKVWLIDQLIDNKTDC